MEMSKPPPPGDPGGPPSIDPIRHQMFLQRIRDEQSLSLAIAAGGLTGLVGAAAWALITARTHTRYSLIAVGIGFAVGWVIQKVGKGIDLSFGIAAAVIALLSVVFGDLLASCALVAAENGQSFIDVAWNLSWDQAVELTKATISYVDLLFYAVAGYFAFRNARRQFSEEEIASLQ